MYHLFWAKYRCIKFHTKFETLTKTLTKSPIKARSKVWFPTDFDQDARGITYKCRILLLNHIFLVCTLHFSLNITHSFLCTYLQYNFVFLKVNKFELYRMARAGTRRRKNFVDNCKCGAWLLSRDEDSSSCLSRPAEWIFGILIFHITLVYSAYTEQ